VGGVAVTLKTPAGIPCSVKKLAKKKIQSDGPSLSFGEKN